jgi:hypothetical protein
LLTPPLAAHLPPLLAAIGLPHIGEVVVEGPEPAVDTPLRVVDAGVLALAAQATSVAVLDRLASRSRQRAVISRDSVLPALRPFPFVRFDGQVSDAWARQITAAPCSGHMSTADGRFVYMANVVPRLREGTLELLGCAPTREAVQAAVARWNANELEQTMADAGLPLTVVRSREEWSTSDQGRVLAATPLVTIEREHDAPPCPLPNGPRALSGLRVLDLTHVVAGPMVTRGLAEHGADVLHVGPPDPELQDPVAVTNELMIGRRSAQLDLRTPHGRSEVERLVAHADVLVQSWRPGVLERLGLGHERVTRLRPGIIQLDISCFGPQGPWAARAGFDGNALAAVGATDIEAQHGPPRLTPPGVLTDSLVGFLGVAVINAILLARAGIGGTRRASMSLARTALWLLDLGVTTPATPSITAPEPTLRPAVTHDGAAVLHLDHPIRYDARPARLSGLLPRLGSSGPVWLGGDDAREDSTWSDQA